MKAQKSIDDAGGKTALIKSLKLVSGECEQVIMDTGDDEICIEVRLQVHGAISTLLTGDPSYDQDHRGLWGSSMVGQCLTHDEAVDIADDLIDQVLDQEAEL